MNKKEIKKLISNSDINAEWAEDLKKDGYYKIENESYPSWEILDLSESEEEIIEELKAKNIWIKVEWGEFYEVLEVEF